MGGVCDPGRGLEWLRHVRGRWEAGIDCGDTQFTDINGLFIPVFTPQKLECGEVVCVFADRQAPKIT